MLTFLVLLPTITLWIINRQISGQALTDARQTLSTADAVFRNSLDILERGLITRFRGIVNEPRFKAVAQLGDARTMNDFLRSSLEEYGGETEVVIYSTQPGVMLAGAHRQPHGDLTPFLKATTDLTRDAFDGEPSIGTVFAGDKAYSVVAVPMPSSDRLSIGGVLTIGLSFGEHALEELKSLTRTDIAIFSEQNAIASTLAHELPSDWDKNLPVKAKSTAQRVVPLKVEGEHFLALAGDYVAAEGHPGFRYLLLSSYEARLEALHTTQLMLAGLSLIGILISGGSVWILIRRITQPLRALRDSAEAVGRGDFTQHIEQFSNDECGEVAGEFNRMTENLLISRNELQKTVDTLRSTESSLRTARDAAEASNRAKTEFIANMSHELRTPMNAIIGMSSVLTGENLPEKTREGVGTIRSSADALLRIIDDILDISKLDAGRLDLNLQPFDLAACIEAMKEPFVARCAERGIEFAVELARDLPPAINGDPARLTQVLNNLLSNAVKFTERGRVVLSVVRGKSENGDDRIQFSVQDTGVGIPANRMDLLFKTFSQVDASTTRRFGGTGIGLAIAKHLVDLMGGKIEVESEVGRGSRFFFSIPAPIATLPRKPDSAAATASNDVARIANSNTPEAAPKKPTPSAAASPALGAGFAQKHPLRILLVEDNPVNAQVAQLLLKRLGYTPDWAVNGRKAVENTESKIYDLVFMDLQMPEMDGLDATREILRTVPDSRLPYIIALTANARQEDRDACAAAGMHDFISKPVQLEKIADGIARAFSWRSTRVNASEATNFAGHE